MRVGISGLAVANGGGLGRLNRTCILALAVARPGWELHVYLRRAGDAQLIHEEEGGALTPLTDSLSFHYGPPAGRLLLEHYVIPQVFSPLKLDGYLGCDFTLPLRKVAPVEAVVVPDLLPFARGAGVSWRARILYSMGLKLAIRRHARLLCISPFTAGRLARVFPQHLRSSVIHPALSPRMGELAARSAQVDHRLQVQGSLGIVADPGRFLLYVGDFGARKNVHMLVEAYRQIVRDGRYGGSLVLAGGDGRYAEVNKLELALQTVTPMPADASGRGGVHDIGRVSDFDLSQLYSQADILVNLSAEEGFGYPVLEALAHGTPALVTADTSMSAIADQGIVQVRPSTDAVATALADMLGRLPELRMELRGVLPTLGTIEQLGEDIAAALEAK